MRIPCYIRVPWSYGTENCCPISLWERHWACLHLKATELLCNNGKWILVSHERVYKCIRPKFSFPLKRLLTCSRTNSPRNTIWQTPSQKAPFIFFKLQYSFQYWFKCNDHDLQSFLYFPKFGAALPKMNLPIFSQNGCQYNNLCMYFSIEKCTFVYTWAYAYNVAHPVLKCNVREAWVPQLFELWTLGFNSPPDLKGRGVQLCGALGSAGRLKILSLCPSPPHMCAGVLSIKSLKRNKYKLYTILCIDFIYEQILHVVNGLQFPADWNVPTGDEC